MIGVPEDRRSASPSEPCTLLRPIMRQPAALLQKLLPRQARWLISAEDVPDDLGREVREPHQGGQMSVGHAEPPGHLVHALVRRLQNQSPSLEGLVKQGNEASLDARLALAANDQSLALTGTFQ